MLVGYKTAHSILQQGWDTEPLCVDVSPWTHPCLRLEAGRGRSLGSTRGEEPTKLMGARTEGVDPGQAPRDGLDVPPTF